MRYFKYVGDAEQLKQCKFSILKIGKIYREDDIIGGGWTVREAARGAGFPDEFQEIPEEFVVRTSEGLIDSRDIVSETYSATTTTDEVNPSHYKNGQVECIDAIKSAVVNKTAIEAVCVANVIKYLWRYEEKGGLSDIGKAKWYLNYLYEELNKNKNGQA